MLGSFCFTRECPDMNSLLFRCYLFFIFFIFIFLFFIFLFFYFIFCKKNCGTVSALWGGWLNLRIFIINFLLPSSLNESTSMVILLDVIWIVALGFCVVFIIRHAAYSVVNDYWRFLVPLMVGIGAIGSVFAFVLLILNIILLFSWV